MKNPKIIARLKKLYALVCHGVAGEKVNAEELLNQLLRKYKLGIDDITTKTPRRTYKITYQDKYKKALFERVYYSIRTNLHSCTLAKKHRAFFPELSKSEYCEFIVKYDIYKKRLAEELELTLVAFIHSQDLWYDGELTYVDENTPRKNMERASRLTNRSSEIGKIQINKQLTD